VRTASPAREIIRRPPSYSIRQLFRGLLELPGYWDLLVVLTAHRIKVRYKQSLLGPAWAVLQPLAMMLVFAAVVSMIARVDTGGVPYALFAFAGLLPWTAFASALSTGATSMVSHAALVTRVAFPREILPLTYVAAALFDMVISSSVLIVLMAYYGVGLTASAIWVIPILAVLVALATAVSLALAAVNVRFRDVSVAMPLLLQVWMFASPVIYPLSAVPEQWRPWYRLNPMSGIVDGFRRAVVEGAVPDLAALGVAAAVSFAALPLAYLWFKRVDATLADFI
jgi:lipopolysaccharide transport system permease protein